VLDGEYMKNVVVRNAVVKYEGGPLKLENTHFGNCTFQFLQTPGSRELGLQLLAGVPLTLSESVKKTLPVLACRRFPVPFAFNALFRHYPWQLCP
jgi:hypothetical protein